MSEDYFAKDPGKKHLKIRLLQPYKVWPAKLKYCQTVYYTIT
jgi:hypothetical protein